MKKRKNKVLGDLLLTDAPIHLLPSIPAPMELQKPNGTAARGIEFGFKEDSQRPWVGPPIETRCIRTNQFFLIQSQILIPVD